MDPLHLSEINFVIPANSQDVRLGVEYTSPNNPTHWEAVHTLGVNDGSLTEGLGLWFPSSFC